MPAKCIVSREKPSSGRGMGMVLLSFGANWSGWKAIPTPTTIAFIAPLELGELTAIDPIQRLTERLLRQEILTSAQVQQMRNRHYRAGSEYLQAHRGRAIPEVDEVESEVYGADIRCPSFPQDASKVVPADLTMVQAVNRVFRLGLESDPSLLFFGEDIEDPKAGCLA